MRGKTRVKTYFLDLRTLKTPYPVVMPVEMALKRVPRAEHEYLVELGRFGSRQELRRMVKRIQQATA